MGLLGGYHAGRLYKTMKGRNWKKAAFLTSTLYPGIIFSLGVFVNFFIWGKHSSGAMYVNLLFRLFVKLELFCFLKKNLKSLILFSVLLPQCCPWLPCGSEFHYL